PATSSTSPLSSTVVQFRDSRSAASRVSRWPNESNDAGVTYIWSSNRLGAACTDWALARAREPPGMAHWPVPGRRSRAWPARRAPALARWRHGARDRDRRVLHAGRRPAGPERLVPRLPGPGPRRERPVASRSGPDGVRDVRVRDRLLRIPFPAD